MANLHLRRFSTLENYQNANIVDGTFFIIVESGQLGVRRGELDILTPPNTLRDYKLPDGEIIITQNDTIAQAIGKLEKRIINLGDNVSEAINIANNAINAVKNLEYNGESDPNVEVRLSQLESKTILISESEFEALEGLDQNKIYYIYEDDKY